MEKEHDNRIEDKETACLHEEYIVDSHNNKTLVKEEWDITEDNPQQMDFLPPGPGAKKLNPLSETSIKTQPTEIANGYECQICRLCFTDYAVFRKHIETHYDSYTEDQSTLSESIKVERDDFGYSDSDNTFEKGLRTLSNGIKEEKEDIGYPENTFEKGMSTELYGMKEEHDLGDSEGSVVEEDQCDSSYDVKEEQEESKETFGLKEYNIGNDYRQPKTIVIGDSDTIIGNVNQSNYLLSDGNTKEYNEKTCTGDKSPHKCYTCGKCFTRSSNLKDHLRIHTGEKPYKCDICKKRFTDNSTLRGHRLTHTHDNTFKCNACNQRYIDLSKLLLHVVTHKKEKPFVCNLCGKCFAAKKNLSLHEIYHSGNKPYQCDFCEKSYGQSSHLQRHVRTHTKEKPYKCDTCGKRFPEKSTLVKHNRIHTGEKKYECKICKMYFTFNTGLWRHMKLHEKRDPCTLPTYKKEEKDKAKVVSVKLKESIFRKEKTVHNGEPVTVVFFKKKKASPCNITKGDVHKLSKEGLKSDKKVAV